jgi:hypothetical protein
MSSSLNIHRVVKVEAKSSKDDNAAVWLELVVEDNRGESFEITFFSAYKAYVSALAAAINEVNAKFEQTPKFEPGDRVRNTKTDEVGTVIASSTEITRVRYGDESQVWNTATEKLTKEDAEEI